MKKRGLMFLLMLMILGLAGCGQQAREIPELLSPVGATMDTAAVYRGNLENVRVLEAVVAPRSQAVCFTSDVLLGEMLVSPGDEVEAGDILARPDASETQGAIAALDQEAASLAETAAYEAQMREIDMELYQLNLDAAPNADARYEIETEMLLYDQEYQNDVSARESRLEAIAAEKAELEKALAGGELLAPCRGRVATVCAQRGQRLAAYETVCVITDEDDLVLQSAYLTPSELAGALEIYAMAGETRLKLIPEAVDEAEYRRSALRGAQYPSAFSVEGGCPMQIGETAALCLVTARAENALLVPVNSVFTENGESYVYVVEGESRVRRDVTCGVRGAAEIEITFGLEEGETVYVGE